MKRGDNVIVSAPGDYREPRSAAVVQSDALDAADSALVALLASAVVDASPYSLTVAPAPANRLKTVPQVMIGSADRHILADGKRSA